jgi:hypothetical protein
MMTLKQNGTVEGSITPQERQLGKHVALLVKEFQYIFSF